MCYSVLKLVVVVTGDLETTFVSHICILRIDNDFYLNSIYPFTNVYPHSSTIHCVFGTAAC